MLAMALWMLTGWAAPALLPPVPPVALTASWTIVELPQVPLGVAEHDGKLWVCGANEMIAMSADGGSHWALLHEKNKGEMLFSFAFPAPDEIQAYGTRGLRLESVNGGHNWQSENSKGGAEFLSVSTDGTVGFGANTWQFGWTTDGGVNWNLQSLPDIDGTPLPDGAKSMLDDLGAVEMDATHAAVLFDGFIAATDDQGKSWRKTPFDANWHWRSLRIEDGAYKLYGYYQAAKGAVHHAAEGVSPDGMKWQLDRGAPAEYTNCNRQGCLVEGGWVDLRGAAPQYFKLPDSNDYVQSWAVSDVTMCQVIGELRCRTGLESMAVPSESRTDAASVDPQPIKTPEGEYDEKARRRGENGNVRVQFTIASDGAVSHLTLLDAATPDFAAAALAAMLRWTFHPGLTAGKPIAVVAQADMSFRLFDRP